MGGLVSRKFGNLSLSGKEHMKKMEYVKDFAGMQVLSNMTQLAASF